MAQISYIRCRHCGEPLQHRDHAYCPACNLYLAYRAMPFLLGMILLGRTASAYSRHQPKFFEEQSVNGHGYDDETVLIME